MSLVPRFVLSLEEIEGLDYSIATRAGVFVPLGTATRQTRSVTVTQQDGRSAPLYSRSDDGRLERRERTGKKREQRSTAAAAVHPSGRQRIIPQQFKIIVSTRQQQQEERKDEPAIADSVVLDEAASDKGAGVQRSRAVYGASSSGMYLVSPRTFYRRCQRGHRQLADYSAASREFNTLGSLVSKGENFRHGVVEEFRTDMKASSNSPPRSDRKACQLHGRLQFANSWAERLIREKNTYRKEIDKLRTQVKQLVSGRDNSRLSRRNEASMATGVHHEDQADTDNGSARESASECSNTSTPLFYENVNERMMPMFTPCTAKVMWDRDPEFSDRSGETGSRSLERSEEGFDVKTNSGEIFSSSRGKLCSHGVGQTRVKSGGIRRAKTMDKRNGIGAQSGESYHRREDSGSWMELSDRDDVSTRIRWKEEGKLGRWPVFQRGQQHRRGYLKKDKHLDRKSTGSQTPLLWKSVAVNTTESGPYPTETEEMLAGLSTDMRLAEEAKACCAEELLRDTRTVVKHGGLESEASPSRPTADVSAADVSTADVSAAEVSAADGSAADGSWEPSIQCKRCALLSESLQDSRSWVNLLELFLLEQSRRNPLPHACMAPQQTNFGRPDTNADMGNSTRPREFDQKEASDSDGGKQENGKEKEELLAAAEAVWRVSEMARDVFEGELNRRGDALEAAKKAVAEADEAFSNRVKELSDARSTIRSQQTEIDKWKSEAEKSNAKEKTVRRALECTRVAAGDAARRSEREAKVFRLETEDLRKKASSLRTRLACVQGRHQTRLEMANKRIKQLEHNYGGNDLTLVNRQCYTTRLLRSRSSEGPPQGKMRPTSRRPVETSGSISQHKFRRSFSCDSFASGRPLELFPEDYDYKVPASWVSSSSREKGVYARGGKYCSAVGEDAPKHSQPPILNRPNSTRKISTEGRSNAATDSRSHTPVLGSVWRPSSMDGGKRSTLGRRASSAVNERDLWVKCFEKARRVSALDYVAKLDMKADKDRVLRRASEYHCPRSPTLTTESDLADRIDDRGEQSVGEHCSSRQQDCLQAIDVAITGTGCVEAEEQKDDRSLEGTPDLDAAVEETTDEVVVERTSGSP